MNKYTYKITGVKGDIVYTDFLTDGLTVEIRGESISDASDKIREYLAHNFLRCDKIILEKIDI